MCKSYTSIGWGCLLSLDLYGLFSWYASGQNAFECVSMLLVSAHPEDVRVSAQYVFDLHFFSAEIVDMINVWEHSTLSIC